MAKQAVGDETKRQRDGEMGAYQCSLRLRLKRDIGDDLRRTELPKVLFAMTYDNPTHREMMDLEGLAIPYAPSVTSQKTLMAPLAEVSWANSS
jgi:hypothetical protein